MTQEEKAKRYDKAIERAKLSRLQLLDIGEEATEIEYIFPELKENENERIRKALIFHYQGDGCICTNEYKIDYKDIRAWLEKQKAVDVLDEEEREFADNVDSYRKEVDAAYQKGYNEGVKATLEKQGEQKPDGKVEPKFHEGEWVVNNTTLNLCHILKMEHGQYICDDCSFPVTKENEYHIWTIQDAKDGDVLAVERDKTPFIFKGFDKFHPGCPVAYCGICNDGIFANSGDGWWADEKVEPATKEQRDLLFSKMKEAGYEWDNEKKELKKIEQNPAWSEDDDIYSENIILAVKKQYPTAAKDIVDWLKSLRLQNTWKPSDEQIKALNLIIITGNISSVKQVQELTDLYKDLKKLRNELL